MMLIKKTRAIKIRRELAFFENKGKSILSESLNENQLVITASNDFSLEIIINQLSEKTPIRVIKTRIFESHFVCQIEISEQLSSKLMLGTICVFCIFTQEKRNLLINSILLPKNKNRSKLLKKVNNLIFEEVQKLINPLDNFDNEFSFLMEKE